MSKMSCINAPSAGLHYSQCIHMMSCINRTTFATALVDFKFAKVIHLNGDVQPAHFLYSTLLSTPFQGLAISNVDHCNNSPYCSEATVLFFVS